MPQIDVTLDKKCSKLFAVRLDAPSATCSARSSALSTAVLVRGLVGK